MKQVDSPFFFGVLHSIVMRILLSQKPAMFLSQALSGEEIQRSNEVYGIT